MHSLLDIALAFLQKLDGEEHNGGGTVSDLVVLGNGDVDESSGGRMLNVK